VTVVTALRAPVPREILPLIAAVAIGGLLAGVLAATPVLFITTPVVAAALAAAAALGKRTPEWNPVATTGRLQDASAALSRWQAAQGSGESLGELARELNDESRYQQEAAQEVEALLA
jgi:hypothetical protein